nr:acyl-CoA dehydrogenase family protein [Nocardioides convexus]
MPSWRRRSSRTTRSGTTRGRSRASLYKKVGDLGVYGIEVPEEYGGAGIESFKFSAVLTEECARAGVNLGGSGVHVESLPALPAQARHPRADCGAGCPASSPARRCGRSR